jgi:hypothetical protein
LCRQFGGRDQAIEVDRREVEWVGDLPPVTVIDAAQGSEVPLRADG